MSQWRLRGYVQDSDEEEEDLETHSTKSSTPSQNAQHERVAATPSSPPHQDGTHASPQHDEPGVSSNVPRVEVERHSSYTPLPRIASSIDLGRGPTESPDPLQRSPIPTKPIVPDPSASSRVLKANPFNLELLSNTSDSESALSEPPSDDEQNVIFASPQRRIGVQVIIPRATVAGSHIDAQGNSRFFRTRKPIQLHPYLLEGERYRQECKNRGLKPVARPRSPPRYLIHDNAETQEQEFDPEDASHSSSPPDALLSSPPGRRQRDDVSRANSTGAPRNRDTPEHVPRMQPNSYSSIGRKRRRLDQPSTQESSFSKKSTKSGRSNAGDIWAIPHSPPQSSSPLVKGMDPAIQRSIITASNVAIPDLPTPSNSSSVQGDVQPGAVAESESNSDRRGRLQLVPLLSDSSSSSSDGSDSESRQSEVEVRRIGKKIKGVLPASWFRLDQRAQKQREPSARARDLSPEKKALQRGIAQRTVKKARSPWRAQASRGHSTEPIIVRDESDSETYPIFNIGNEVQESARDASETAAEFDSRYAEDDLASMENDRLHIFTLGGDDKKRKRQVKLTDVFQKSKKPRFADEGPRGPRVTGAARLARSARQGLNKITRSRRRYRTPPSLSIVDIDGSPAKNHGALPQFIRVAQRRAREWPDYARQSPRNKHIRLHTIRDTKDAEATLQGWRKGSVKPKQATKSQQKRPPLAERSDNQQLVQELPLPDKHSIPEQATTMSPQTVPDHLPPTDTVFGDEPSRKSTRAGVSQAGSSPSEKKQNRLLRGRPVSFRAGQLEGLESDLGNENRKIVFERGLQRADQQFTLRLPRWQPSINPQLVRFLANDDEVLPPLPSTEDTSEGRDHSTDRPVSGQKRRLPRKNQARRIDVDAREYRQPSEPALVDLVNDTIPDETRVEDGLILEGLGPYGTRYPTTFDVFPLVPGTYFHSDTFVGGGELRQALYTSKRDMDAFAGQCSVTDGFQTINCGSWNDETYSQISALLSAVWHIGDDPTVAEGNLAAVHRSASQHLSKILRTLIKYLQSSLSFLDAIDRQDFSTRITQLLDFQFQKIFQSLLAQNPLPNASSRDDQQCLQAMAYLLVVCFQVRQIGQHPIVEPTVSYQVTQLMWNIAQAIVRYLVHQGVPELAGFLEKNKRYSEREDGIGEHDALVQCLVICMHVLNAAAIPNLGYWDIVSQLLSTRAENVDHVKGFESIWTAAFTFLPFVEFDDSGVLVVNRRSSLTNENWTFIKDWLNRLFFLYPGTRQARSSSLNEYVRATMTRCHVLIDTWHWKRCDPALSSMFDFFAKHGLRQLLREESKGSPQFLELLADQPSLGVEPSDSAFHIFLKCVALGLGRLKAYHAEKKIRSIVFRWTPNHGRSYPKDQPLEQENLGALRNHHDLLCTLYWASPPSCRPKLDLIRGLVQHETSHREACRLNVRAWANLTLFQLSVDEPYSSLEPFALWHKEIMQQTLKQYRTAKTEAEDFFKAAQSNGDSDISTHLVRTTINQNQGQVIATLQDCIAGMLRAVKQNLGHALLRSFLIDSGIVQLLELAHVDDLRLTIVIRETLAIFRENALLQQPASAAEVSQPASEESQDYGDFPDLEDLDDAERPLTNEQSHLGFIQTPLWHLLSNAFGAERTPDDNLLMDCIDTWVLVASTQVSVGERSWSHYLDSFSQVSWPQLRDTEQSRKFKPYFMASLLLHDPSAYKEHPLEFIKTLLLSLVDRESMLRFQHRLLHAIVHFDRAHPLLKNLPFYRDDQTGQFDITADTVRTRRTSLLSSILANMRDDLHNAIAKDPHRFPDARREYAALLKEFMVAMKHNYQQLRQGTSATGAYVEFVQKMVQFLKQYTSDICPVNPFFTDSVAFPLPADDPTYVVGRLCGYAPKLANPGVAKQLSTFIQTVVQQAALDKQQQYLVRQLSTSLTDKNGDPSVNRSALRSVLLQGVFPAYVEAAFDSTTGLVVAKPILQALKGVVENMFFSVRVADASNIEDVCNSIWRISCAFVKGTDNLKESPSLLKQPHVLNAITLLLDVIVSFLPILDYISERSSRSTSTPAIVLYCLDLTVFLAEVIHDIVPPQIPAFDVESVPHSPHSDLLEYCSKNLNATIRNDWHGSDSSIFFGHGPARREVVVDLGMFEEEREGVVGAIERFHATVTRMYGEGEGAGSSRTALLKDVVV